MQLYETKASLLTGRTKGHRGTQRGDHSTVLDALAKYRKATINLVMSIRLFLRM
jgi:hypothetical protein